MEVQHGTFKVVMLLGSMLAVSTWLYRHYTKDCGALWSVKGINAKALLHIFGVA